MRRSLLLLFFLLIKSVLIGQTSGIYKSLNTQDYPIFTSLEEALKTPQEVKYLSLRHQQLRKIPDEVFLLKNLEILDLSKNKLQELPPQIAELTALQQLDVSSNKLTTLPHELGGCNRLTKILASRNNISMLPPSIGELHHLQILDLWQNEIDTFPWEIQKLQELKIVDLRGIMMNDDQKSQIRSLCGKADVLFSPGCNCIK